MCQHISRQFMHHFCINRSVCGYIQQKKYTAAQSWVGSYSSEAIVKVMALSML